MTKTPCFLVAATDSPPDALPIEGSRCSGCHRVRSDAEFYEDRVYRRSVCKECENRRARDWRRTPYGKVQEALSDSRRRAKAGGYAPCGTDTAILVAALTDQCELGRRRETLVLDHDHVSGQFRGWLCRACNAGIGQLRDDPALVRAAAAYLERIPRG